MRTLSRKGLQLHSTPFLDGEAYPCFLANSSLFIRLRYWCYLCIIIPLFSFFMVSHRFHRHESRWGFLPWFEHGALSGATNALRSLIFGSTRGVHKLVHRGYASTGCRAGGVLWGSSIALLAFRRSRRKLTLMRLSLVLIFLCSCCSRGSHDPLPRWNSTSDRLVSDLLIACFSPLFGSDMNRGFCLPASPQPPPTSCQPCLALIPHYLDILPIHMAYPHTMSDAFDVEFPNLPTLPSQNPRNWKKKIGGALRCKRPRIASCEMTKVPSGFLPVSLKVDKIS